MKFFIIKGSFLDSDSWHCPNCGVALEQTKKFYLIHPIKTTDTGWFKDTSKPSECKNAGRKYMCPTIELEDITDK